MRIRIVALVIAAATLAAPAGAVSADAGLDKDRPLRVSVDFDFAPIGLCANGDVLFGMQGDGVASHLGRVDLAGSYCIAPETGVISSGEGTYTAANGDEMTITFDGLFITEEGTVTGGGTAVVTGGNGRFASATGGYEWTGSGPIDPITFVGALSLDATGVIAYDASRG